MRDSTKDNPNDPPALLDTVQAARFLGLGERTLENWRVRGEGPEFLKISRAVRYDPRTLAEYLDARRCRSTSEADHRAAA